MRAGEVGKRDRLARMILAMWLGDELSERRGSMMLFTTFLMEEACMDNPLRDLPPELVYEVARAMRNRLPGHYGATSVATELLLKLLRNGAKGKLSMEPARRRYIEVALMRICIERLRRDLNRKNKEQEAAALTPESLFTSQNIEDLRQSVREAMERLKQDHPFCGTIGEAFYLAGMNYGQIAVQQRVSISIVKSELAKYRGCFPNYWNPT